MDKPLTWIDIACPTCQESAGSPCKNLRKSGLCKNPHEKREEKAFIEGYRIASKKPDRGPWQYTGGTVESPNTIVCASGDWGGEITEGNGKLIAAAPDMYNALYLVLDFYNLDTEDFVLKYGHGVSTKSMCDKIREVLRTLND